MLRQLRRPYIPGVQAGTKAMEQKQHRLIGRGLRRKSCLLLRGSGLFEQFGKARQRQS
jgi:hypothetical protein